jgi:O-antigen chain-terminating methyltransferase
MSQDQGAHPPKPDVAALLAEVEAAVQDKKAQGLYNPAEVRRVEEAALDLSRAADDGALAELALRQANLQQLWDPKACGVVTHRGGLAGRLLVNAKRLLHRVTRPYLNIALARQTAFNDELVKLLNVMVPQHSDLRPRMLQSERRLDAAEDLGRFLASEHGHRIKELERTGEARLSALERGANRGRGELEALLARLQEIVASQARAGLAAPEAAEAVGALRSQSRGAAYLAFEDLHRGTREEIKRRQGVYLPYFAEAASEQTPVLDLGCGRGEFLELCRDHGVPARGVDVNPEMAAFCREQGLEAVEADALAHLRALDENSLGGILLSQVIEHLTLDQLMELTALCASRLKPGGALIAETVNPQSLSTFAGAFYLDLTHIKPVHPEAARFLWRAQGLGQVEVVYLSPVPAEHKLEPVAGGESGADLAGAFNRNVKRLNELLYGPQDYAVVGRK